MDVHVEAVGSGHALAIAARGDVDVLLVHDRAGEDNFVADGYGIDRRDVMYNDFVIVGPRFDPAGIRGLKDARKAFGQIAAKGALFASRGDSGGTYQMELRLWKLAGVEPAGQAWYRDVDLSEVCFKGDCVAKLKNELATKIRVVPAEAGIWQANAL